MWTVNLAKPKKGVMNHGNYPSHFHPSFEGNGQSAALWLWLVIGSLLLIGVLAYYYVDYDHPFILATVSRALYVDEGFYADAAQNLVKFGSWDLPYDSRHWPGAPFLAFLQSITFSVVGVSLTAARMLSVGLSIMGGLALYSIARTRMTPAIAGLLTLSGVLTLNFVAHGRAAIPDPAATSLSLLAIAAFVRIRNRSIAIPLSLLLAFFAFSSKMYFLFAFATLIGLWLAELFLVPAISPARWDLRAMGTLVISLVAIGLGYWLYRSIYIDEITNFLHINSNKKPRLDPTYLYYSVKASLQVLAYNTKAHVFLIAMGISTAYFLLSRLMPHKLMQLWSDIRSVTRGEWAMGMFLVLGLFVIGSLRLHKAHYHFFAILPIVFLGVAFLNRALPAKYRLAVISVFVLGHLAYQAPLYYQWFERPQKTTIVDASIEMARLIDTQSTQKVIPVIGEYSAELALFSMRMHSLDAKWISMAGLCERLDYWKPPYHVNVVWPGSASARERDKIVQCDGVSEYKELARYNVFAPWKDEIVLSQLIYNADQ